MKNKTLKKENRFLKKELKKTKEYKKILDYEINIMGLYRIKEKEFFKIHYLLSNNYDAYTDKFVKNIYSSIKIKRGLTEKQMNLLIKIIQKEVPLYILNS